MSAIRHILPIAAGAMVLAVAGIWWLASRRAQPDILRLAAGSTRSESYQLAKAIRDVATTASPDLLIEVVATAGSAENMHALEQGEVEAILAQADTKPCLPARLVARMFPEDFQLIVQEDAGISRFADLKGRRVGLASEGSGQHASFWFVANHYGIHKNEVKEVTGPDPETDEMFMRGEVDAVFRVRPPQNPAIQRLVGEGPGQLLPIEQTRALGLKHATLEPSTIPMGAYQGAPPIPPTDLPTVSAPRLLFASENTPADLVRRLTALLYENRFQLVERMPLASFISPLSENQPALVPVHRGARAFYDREKPNFLQENADFVALILTILLLLASWAWGLKRFLDHSRKDRADRHNLLLADLMRQASEASDTDTLETIRRRLIETFDQVVRELDTGRIDTDSLQSFGMVWNAAAHTARDRDAALRLRN